MTNGLMAIPNLVAVIYLSPIAISLIKDFYSRHIYETGEAGGGSAVSSAVQVLSGFGKDLFRSMYTPTYKLVMEKR